MTPAGEGITQSKQIAACETCEGITQSKQIAACETCAGNTFRRSRLQWKDAGTLLSLQYPVRCLSCGRRQSVAWAAARRAVPSSVKQALAADTPSTHDGTPQNHPASLHASPGPPERAFPTLPKRAPVVMPDLHGVTLTHVVHVPPGDGEDLAS